MSAAVIPKRPSCLYWSEVEKWMPLSSLLRFGNLPSGWRLLPVNEFATLIDNKERVEPNTEYRMAGVKWYGAGVFKRETVLGKEQSANYLHPLKPGSIIYNRLFAWKKSFAVVAEDFVGLYVSNEFPQFEINKDVALPEYVYLIFNTQKVIRAVNAASIGSAAISRNRFKESDFLSFKVPIPPLSVQQKIVAFWENELDHQQKLLSKKDEIRGECKSFSLNSLGIKRVVPKKIEKMFCLNWANSERWSYEYNKRVLSGMAKLQTGKYQTVTLGEICKGQSGSTPSKKNLSFWRNGNVLWVSPKDMKAREISNTIDHITSKAVENHQAPVVPKGSILFVVRSGILQKTVPVAVTRESVTINQDMRAFTIRNDNVLPDFLLSYFEAKQEELLHLVKWSTTVQSINKEELESFSVPLPPINIQKNIILSVNKFHAEINNCEAEYQRSILSSSSAVEQMILGL